MSSSTAQSGAAQTHAEVREVRIVVVGAGIAGLGAGIRLLESGYRDFVVLERADRVGGTWRDNSYPGCAVDVPSAYYQLSFAPKADWSHTFARQAELLEYLENLLHHPGLAERVKLGCEMVGARWDDELGRWLVETSGGVYSAELLVPAVGILNKVSTPEVPGLDKFRGTVFHTARWNHKHDLAAERVAVIGTGSTASQVIPAIAPRVGQLYVFQRSAGWVWPRIGWKVSPVEKWLMRRFPSIGRLRRLRQRWTRELQFPALLRPGWATTVLEKISVAQLNWQIRDPELRAKLLPKDRFGCKRAILSSEYYPTFNRDNVELVTEGIREIRQNSIVTVDGREREIDSLVLATGFKPYEWAEAARVIGADGRTLDHDWKEHGARSYLGGAVAGFPNLFYVVGPNTAVFTSIIYVIEAFIEHLIEALRAMDDNKLAVLEVRKEAQEAFAEEMDRRLVGTVWTAGCTSWLLHDTKHNQTLWPSNTVELKARLRQFDLPAYRCRRRDDWMGPPPRPGLAPALHTQLL